MGSGKSWKLSAREVMKQGCLLNGDADWGGDGGGDSSGGGNSGGDSGSGN